MEMKEQKSPDLILISGYGEGGFKVHASRHKGNILVTPSAFYPWTLKSIKTIQKQSLKSLFEGDISPEFILFGLGEEVIDGVLLARSLTKKFGLPCEVMSTGAAVRTYNVLAMEGRQVAAAILAV